MNKKGAIELSMNTIIIIVMGVVLLSLGLMFVRGIFSQVEGLSKSAFETADAEIGIMSNARCLTEGVDIPLVDAIAFIDPKKSIIDIVQATGRAMRKAKWKEKGYIFVPVVVEESINPEIYLESSDFKTVWQVLQAMVDSDNHLQDIVSRIQNIFYKFLLPEFFLNLNLLVL